MKILIIGHARHGKDTAAEILEKERGFKFKSSSEAAAEIFIYDLLKEKYNYKSFKECYDDRINHRAEWYNLICEYNKEDKTRLCKNILKTSDCYVGMRDYAEVISCRQNKLFDYIIWISADERLPLENSDSFNITEDLCDYIVYNNGTLDEFKTTILNLYDNLNNNTLPSDWSNIERPIFKIERVLENLLVCPELSRVNLPRIVSSILLNLRNYPSDGILKSINKGIDKWL